MSEKLSRISSSKSWSLFEFFSFFSLSLNCEIYSYLARYLVAMLVKPIYSLLFAVTSLTMVIQAVPSGHGEGGSSTSTISIESFPTLTIPHNTNSQGLTSHWKNAKREARNAQSQAADLIREEIEHGARLDGSVNPGLDDTLRTLGANYGIIAGWKNHFGSAGQRQSKGGRRAYSANKINGETKMLYEQIRPLMSNTGKPERMQAHWNGLPNELVQIDNWAANQKRIMDQRFPGRNR